MNYSNHYCTSCGFNSKRGHRKCPNCGAANMENLGTKFRLSKKNRTDRKAIESPKSLNELINHNVRKDSSKNDAWKKHFKKCQTDMELHELEHRLKNPLTSIQLTRTEYERLVSLRKSLQ